MKKTTPALKSIYNLFFPVLLLAISFLSACKQEVNDKKIRQIDPVRAARMAASVDSLIKPELADDLTISLWGIDSLVISPIAIDIDDDGKLILYYHQQAKKF